MEFVGVQDTFGEVATTDVLKEHFGLMAKDIAAAAKRAVSRK